MRPVSFKFNLALIRRPVWSLTTSVQKITSISPQTESDVVLTVRCIFFKVNNRKHTVHKICKTFNINTSQNSKIHKCVSFYFYFFTYLDTRDICCPLTSS